MVISSVLPTVMTSPMERLVSMRRMRASTGVAHIAEAARLLARAIDANGRVVEGGLDEIGKHHSVAAGLPGTDGIEQADDNNGQLLFLPVGNSEKLIESLGGGVAPAAFGCGAKDEVGIFVERNICVLAVDFGGGSGKDEFLFLAGSFEINCVPLRWFRWS